MKKQRVIANALHKGEFEVVPHEGHGAMTEIPMNDSQKGFIHLPEVDGKSVTENTLASLKAHEYAHIVMEERDILPLSFIKDMREAGADPTLIQTCMDAAVNSFIGLRCKHLPFQSLEMSSNKFYKMFRELSLEMKTSMLLQHLGVYKPGYEYDYYLNPHPEVNKTCKKLRLYLKKMQAILHEETGGHRIAIAVDRLVDYCLGGLRRNSKDFSYDTYLERCKDLIEVVEKTNQMLDSQDNFNQTAEEEYEFDAADDMKWGEFEMDESEMSLSVSRLFKQRHTPRYIGSLRYMHRSNTDMKVWGLRDKGVPPIAMLIDCSGSMHVESSSIQSIMAANPASIVAGYSGSETKGAVYILGKNGKYANAQEIEAMRMKHGYGNIIDGPAMDWLVRQKGRLIWISDGRLTGAGEKQHRVMFEFVKFLVEKFNVEHYKSVYAFEAEKQSEFVIPRKFE